METTWCGPKLVKALENAVATVKDASANYDSAFPDPTLASLARLMHEIRNVDNLVHDVIDDIDEKFEMYISEEARDIETETKIIEEIQKGLEQDSDGNPLPKVDPPIKAEHEVLDRDDDKKPSQIRLTKSGTILVRTSVLGRWMWVSVPENEK